MAGLVRKANIKDRNTVLTGDGHYGLFKARIYYGPDGLSSKIEVRTAGLSKNAIAENSLVSLRNGDS